MSASTDRTPSKPPPPDAILLVTGGTGMVGSHVIERAVQQGWKIRALIRSGSDVSLLRRLPVELIEGDMTDPASLTRAVEGITHIVHCAAKVGDWGPVKEYRKVNVDGLRSLLDAALKTGLLQRFVQISSLGVYPARHHYNTDETSRRESGGSDPYVLSKVESERMILEYRRSRHLPGIVLRPGWVYGPRDRVLLPRLLKALKERKVVYLGTGEQLLDHLSIDNLVDAIFLALDRPDLDGQVYNLTDGKLVSRIEFMETICRLADLPVPRKHISLLFARVMSAVQMGAFSLLRKKKGPLLSSASIRFLGLNLEYNINRAREELKYEPRVTFPEGIEKTMKWVRKEEIIERL